MSLILARRMQAIAPFYVMSLLQRAQQLQQQGREVIHLEIGEPDFPTPAPIVNAGIQFLQTHYVRYTPAAGLPELRQRIAEYYQQYYRLTIDQQRIFVTPGASGALLLALAATINPDEQLLMPSPGYPCNPHFLQLLAAEAGRIPVGTATNYHLTAELITQYWQPHTRGVWCASPANPTGTVIEPMILKELIAQTERLGGYFLSDEIYHGLEYQQPTVSALNFSDQALVINSFSKYFGMTGWRLGWLIVPPVLIEAVEKLAQNLWIASSTPAQYAALAAFDPATIDELIQRREQFRQRRDFLYQALADLGFNLDKKPEGAFYIYANCAKFTNDSFNWSQQLLESTGVAITPGKDFGGAQAHLRVRFAYTTSIERLREAVYRINRYIQMSA